MCDSFIYARWTRPRVEVYIKCLHEVSGLFVDAVPQQTINRVLSLLLYLLPDSANLVSKKIDIGHNQPVGLLKGV